MNITILDDYFDTSDLLLQETGRTSGRRLTDHVQDTDAWRGYRTPGWF